MDKSIETILEMCKNVDDREFFRWDGKRFIFNFAPGAGGRYRKSATITTDQVRGKIENIRKQYPKWPDTEVAYSVLYPKNWSEPEISTHNIADPYHLDFTFNEATGCYEYHDPNPFIDIHLSIPKEVLESNCVITHRSGNHYRVRTSVKQWTRKKLDDFMDARPVDSIKAMRKYLSLPKEDRIDVVIIPGRYMTDREKADRGLGTIIFDQATNAPKFYPSKGNGELVRLLDEHSIDSNSLFRPGPHIQPQHLARRKN